jgi:hypothetical protein
MVEAVAEVMTELPSICRLCENVLQSALAALGLSANLVLLLMGISCFSVGVLLMFHHRREWEASFVKGVDARTRKFEDRKFRRRAVLATMISSAGCVMASTYWLVDPRRWATMMGVLILMLLGIILLAFLDLFSVGLREITKGNETAHEEMVQKYLELREKQQREQAVAENSAGESDEEK